MTDPYRIDSHKLMFHPLRVGMVNASRTWDIAKQVAPIYVEISPVGACNHRCTFCAVSYIGFKTRQLDATMLNLRFQEMAMMGVRSVMFAGEGEPLLHKQINDINAAAQTSGLDTAFTTNGVLLDKLDLSRVQWVKVSVNAGTRDSYNAVHKANPRDWDRVWENLTDAVKRKGDCTVGVQMVVLPETAHEITAMEQRCAMANVDYLVLKPYSQHKMSLDHTRQYEGFVPQDIKPAWERTIWRADTAAKTELKFGKCRATPMLWAYVMASGDVYSCSAYLEDHRFLLGNLNKQTFRDIWHGDARRKNWEFVTQELDIGECRVNCRMAHANEYLEAFHTTPHLNFI